MRCAAYLLLALFGNGMLFETCFADEKQSAKSDLEIARNAANELLLNDFACLYLMTSTYWSYAYCQETIIQVKNIFLKIFF